MHHRLQGGRRLGISFLGSIGHNTPHFAMLGLVRSHLPWTAPPVASWNIDALNSRAWRPRICKSSSLVSRKCSSLISMLRSGIVAPKSHPINFILTLIIHFCSGLFDRIIRYRFKCTLNLNSHSILSQWSEYHCTKAEAWSVAHCMTRFIRKHTCPYLPFFLPNILIW